MGRRRFPSEVEHAARVFYLPHAKAFWTGRNNPTRAIAQSGGLLLQDPAAAFRRD